MIAAIGKLALGVILVMALGVAAMTLEALPGSLPAAQKRLQAQAETALTDAGVDWAHVTMDGQKAVLRGAAPSAEAQEEAAATLASAEWSGGLVLGGVTAVDVNGASIAETPPLTEDSRIATSTSSLETQNSPEPLPIETPTFSEPEPVETAEPAATLATETQDAVGEMPKAEEAQEPIDLAEAEAPPPEATQDEADCFDNIAEIAAARRITFATARTEIDAASRAHLLNIADALNACPDATLVITGHTDSRGRETRNRQLSLYRADAVAAYLRSVGVSPDNLETNGLGSSEPLTSNATEDGRAQNRRIEFTVIAAPSEGTE